MTPSSDTNSVTTIRASVHCVVGSAVSQTGRVTISWALILLYHYFAGHAGIVMGPPTIPPDFMGARPTYWRRPRMAPALIFLRCMSFGSCFVRPRFGNKPHITGDSGRGFLANYAETHTHDLHYPAPPSVLCSIGSAIQPGRYTGQTLSTKLSAKTI
jgi:hypothetical protein